MFFIIISPVAVLFYMVFLLWVVLMNRLAYVTGSESLFAGLYTETEPRILWTCAYRMGNEKGRILPDRGTGTPLFSSYSNSRS